MHWQRGVAFASIHLILAASVLMWGLSHYWPYLRSVRNQSTPAFQKMASSPNEEHFNPCDEGGGWDGPIPAAYQLFSFANLPVVIASGGEHVPCTFGSSPLVAATEKRFGRTRKSESIILIVQCAAIACLWFLVGGFPLYFFSKWWLEPGALITILVPLVAVIVFLPGANQIYGTAAVLTFLAWGDWLVLMIVRLTLSARRRIGYWNLHRARRHLTY